MRTLIVEDEADLRTLLFAYLTRDDRFDVIGQAVDGQDAVERSKALSPDLIVLDLRMPRLSGLDALPLLRQSCPDAAVAVLTAHLAGLSDHDQERVRSHGAVLFPKRGDLSVLADDLHALAQRTA